MGEAALFKFELSQVATALIKAQGLKEGIWYVGFEFGFGAANAGPSLTEIKPSMIMSINNLTLVRLKEGEPVPSFAVDAAQIV
jgi:hypothetical protein